jgi:hypothetical protein
VAAPVSRAAISRRAEAGDRDRLSPSDKPAHPVPELPDAIAIPGSLQGDLHAVLDVLLRRAQQAGTVRPDITTLDVIALLKGLLTTINDAPRGPTDQGRVARLPAVVTDGLRPA